MRKIRRMTLGIVLWGVSLGGCATYPLTPEKPPEQPVRTTITNPQRLVSRAPESNPPQASTSQLHVAESSSPVYDDLWDRIRAGFSLPDLDNQYVKYYERWYQSRPDYLQRVVERARRYLFYIVEEVEKRGMPTEIALLPGIESAFKPTAYSRAHAAGLWQFIPSTGRHYGLKQNWWYDGRRDVVRSTHAALNYLEKLNNEFNGDWFLALAAYNAGEKRVHKAIAYNRKRGRDASYANLRLKAETRRYVPKLIALKNIVLNPARYGLRLDPISNQRFFAEVDTKSQVDLSVISELAGIPHSELRNLNPAFRRWATDPHGPHRLLVPATNHQHVQSKIAMLGPDKRMRWLRHRIRRGDTLSTIARRYGVTVGTIKTTNKMRGTYIREGRDLLIPVSHRRYASARGTNRRKAKNRSTGGDAMVYRVRSGDTLWAIAQRHDVYVRQLTRWNAIRVNDVLRLGQKILIYQN
jgi:membrane-bound lytic murein transglycosylase D